MRGTSARIGGGASHFLNRNTTERKQSSVSTSILDKDRRMCPVCGQHELGYYEICACGWQNDPIQFSNPDYSGGANDMSLNEAREAYLKGKQVK